VADGRAVQRLPDRAIAGAKFLSWRDALRRICPNVPGRLEIELKLAKILIEAPADDALRPVMSWLRAKSLQAYMVWFDRSAIRSWRQGFTASLWPRPGSANSMKCSWRTAPGACQCKICRRRFAPVRLPAPLLLHDEMPSSGWDFFTSQKVKPSIYLFSPCCMYWEDTLSDSQRRFPDEEPQSQGPLFSFSGSIRKAISRTLIRS